jgi:hypothetical protein
VRWVGRIANPSGIDWTRRRKWMETVSELTPKLQLVPAEEWRSERRQRPWNTPKEGCWKAYPLQNRKVHRPQHSPNRRQTEYVLMIVPLAPPLFLLCSAHARVRVLAGRATDEVGEWRWWRGTRTRARGSPSLCCTVLVLGMGWICR